MGFGPLALMETTIVDPAPKGAPEFVNLNQPPPGGSFRLEVFLPSDTDVEGCVLLRLNKADVGVNPFTGLSVEEALELDGVTVLGLAGGPESTVVFEDAWGEGEAEGDVIAFAAAASDDWDNDDPSTSEDDDPEDEEG